MCVFYAVPQLYRTIMSEENYIASTGRTKKKQIYRGIILCDITITLKHGENCHLNVKQPNRKLALDLPHGSMNGNDVASK